MKLEKTHYNIYAYVQSNTHIRAIWEIVALVVHFWLNPYWWRVLTGLGRCPVK